MGRSQVSKFFTVLCVVAMILLQHHSAAGLSTAEQRDVQDIHDSARMFATPRLPKLTWNQNVATAAEAWAKGCVYGKATNSYKSYGQNTFTKTTTYSFTVFPQDLVQGVYAWYDEIDWYDQNTNTCKAPAGRSCANYTQLIWKNTTSFGCGYAKCERSAAMNPQNKFKTVLNFVCFYSPAGNIIGQSPYTGDGSESMCDAQAYLASHNQIRQILKPGMKLMAWNDSVARYAQKWSNACQASHNLTTGVGQNIYGTTGNFATANDAVMAWLSEKVDYNYDTLTCAPGKVCGHYTQLAWENSVQLGCGCTYCPTAATWKYIVVCDYMPRGNVAGQKPF